MTTRWLLLTSISVQLHMVLSGRTYGTTTHSASTTTSVSECQVQPQMTERFGVIVSSPDFPQPDNSSGCLHWFINGGPNDTITLSFENFDVLSESPTECTSGEVELGPLPSVTLCGELRYMNSTKRSYISLRNHVWIKYRRQPEQIGRGFKLSYIISEKKASSCYKDYFHCTNGDCILPKWGCNGGRECSDGSDETGCDQVAWPPPPMEPYKCRSGYFGCNDTTHREYRCFPHSFMCDGTKQCIDGKDELHCSTVGQCAEVLEGPSGIITSPGYPSHNPESKQCQWDIHIQRGSVIQLRFRDFRLDPQSHDFVEVRDLKDDVLLGHFTFASPPPPIIQSFSNRLSVLFQSSSQGNAEGFNTTFQEKGVCLVGQEPCGFGELDCYEEGHRCDEKWDCPLMGGDERGCGQCASDKFSCGNGNQCYKDVDHCNGISLCTTKVDETFCSPHSCGRHNGTFLCANERCIYESWRCDGADDCEDNSDEANCPLSRKVVIAAVVGSLVCALLLTVALGCTCQLHALRVREQNRRHYQSPLTRLQEVIASNRLAPPNYSEAMTTSRSYDEAQREFLQRMEEARGRGDVDIPSLITEVTTPPSSTVTVTESESGPATRRHPRPQRQARGDREPPPRPPPPAPPQSPLTPSESSQDQDDRSESSDDSMIDVEPTREISPDSSNVMVNISLDAEISAQWRRQHPKDHTRAIMPAITEDQRDDGEDSASGSINSSVEIADKIESNGQKTDAAWTQSALNKDTESNSARESVSSADSILLSLNEVDTVHFSSKGTVSKNNDDADMISLESLSSHSRSDEQNIDLTTDYMQDDSAMSESDLSAVKTDTVTDDTQMLEDDSVMVDVPDTQSLLC